MSFKKQKQHFIFKRVNFQAGGWDCLATGVHLPPAGNTREGCQGAHGRVRGDGGGGRHPVEHHLRATLHLFFFPIQLAEFVKYERYF